LQSLQKRCILSLRIFNDHKYVYNFSLVIRIISRLYSPPVVLIRWYKNGKQTREQELYGRYSAFELCAQTRRMALVMHTSANKLSPTLSSTLIARRSYRAREMLPSSESAFHPRRSFLLRATSLNQPSQIRSTRRQVCQRTPSLATARSLSCAF